MAKEEQIKSQIVLDGEKEYRAACKGINASLREIGSEMKLTTAEFGANANSMEALTKKQDILKKSLEEQAKKAKAAEDALKKMREGGIDPTDPAYQKMQTNLNNTKADMANLQREIDGITESLNKTTPASEGFAAEAANIDKELGLLASEMKVVSAEYEGNADSAEALKAKLSVLQKTYAEQEKKVQSLEKALDAAKSEYGENSDEAREYERQLNECRAELKSTKTQVEKTTESLEKSSGSWDKIGSVIGKAGKAIGTGVKAMGATVAAMGAAIGAAAGAFLGLAESTREARENMGKLETGFTTAGHSAEDAKNTYTELYGILGDDGQATEAAAHLAKLTNSEKELSDWTNICTGVYATFGDSLPIEGLTEAANETAKTGAITGNLADALNWAGVSEDEFQAKLDACSSEQERQALITETLNGLYSDAAEKYREVNGDIIDAQKATANLNSAMADLGAVAEPIVTRLKTLAAELLQQITPFVELIGTGLAGALEGAEGAAEQFSEGLLGLLTFAVERLTGMLPTFLNFAMQMIETLANGIIAALPTLIPAITEIVTQIIQILIDNIPMLITVAAQIIQQLATGIGTALPTLIPMIVQIVVQIVQTLIDNIPLLIDAALQLITGLAQGVINAIPVLVAALPTLITSLIDGLLSAIPQIIQAGIDLLTALIDALPQIIETIVAAIPEIINGIITALLENIPQIIQAGIDLLVALIQALPQIITTIVQAIPQIISGIVNALVQNIPQIIQAGVQLFVALIQNLPTIIVEIVKAVPQIVSGIVSAFGSLIGEMVNAGANLLHGLWEGISNAASWLWEKVTGWASGLVDGIKNFFGIHSPSTVFAEIGTNMGEGVGVGFGDSMDGVSSDMTAAMGGAGQLTAAEAVRSVNDGIIANIDGLSGAINAIVERVINGLTAQAQRFNQAGQDFDKHISSGMISAIPQITSKIPQIAQSIVTAFNAQSQRFKQTGVTIDQNVASGMISAIPQITAKIPQIAQSIVTAFSAQNQKFIQAGVAIDKNIASGMVQGISQITGKVAQIVQPVLTELRSFVSQFTEAGEEMVRGIWQGFQNMSGWLEDRVREMMRDIVDAVEDEMDINSPSRVFAGIGKYMAQGLGEGFGREMRNVEKAIRRATDNAVPDSRDPRPRRGGRPETHFEVVQNIYANDTSYAQQQREAARQFRMIAREVMT